MKKLLSLAVLLMGSSLIFAQGNTNDVNSLGVDNLATVLQIGLENNSDIDQDGAMDVLGGVENWASVFQLGAFNNAVIDQRGDRNRAFAVQLGEGNDSYQTQGVGWSEDNFQFALQDGNYNTSYQLQRWDNNTGIVHQFGNKN